MAVEIHFKRTLRGLEPANEEATEALKLWKPGADVRGMFSGIKEVNPHRRYFFGMVQLVLDNSDVFGGSKELAEESIKLSVGHVNKAMTYKNGQWEITLTPKTVAGKAMNETEWRDFNRRVEKLICEVLCVSQEQLADAMTDWMAPQLKRGRAA
jgi:hypothetical protein